MKRVLLVDDDKDFLDELTQSLDDCGYETCSTTDGQTTVKKAVLFRPDVILLDMKIGAVNGFDVAQRLQENPATARIPIIGLTGFFTELHFRTFMGTCGIRQCLLKPVDVQNLITAIEEKNQFMTYENHVA